MKKALAIYVVLLTFAAVSGALIAGMYG